MPIDKNADNIQVMVRVRPLNSREQSEESKSCVIVDEGSYNTIILDTKPESKKFVFDWVGGDKTTQEDVFEVAGKPMVQACLEGYNCCIFAYGQTGAGKTYTMQGRGFESDDADNKSRGLQPRVFDYIFAITSQEMRDTVDIQYLITCSYLEIYNEQIMDLLDPLGSTLQVREDLKKGVYVEGVKEEVVGTSEETIELLRLGAMNRHVGATNMNIESSRSHSIFTMTIESKKCVDGMIHVKASKFNFVDLAGSERQKQTASTGERLKEAGNINRSLLVLGQVINSLVEAAEGKQRHIRYRDSKLTFILKDSLGGNAKTCLIANISPASSASQETLSTLKFAQRAKQIKNQALINEDSSGSIEVLKKEIQKLKNELYQAQNMIKSLETDQKRGIEMPLSAPPTQVVEEILTPDIQRKLFDINRGSIYAEILLKQNLEAMLNNESKLQIEIARKEDYVNVFKSAVDLYNMNELQYRSIIALYDSKMKMWNKIVAKGMLKGADYNTFLVEENLKLMSEREALVNIVANTPLIMKVFLDNIELRDRMEMLEGDANPTSSFSIARQLEQNLEVLRETISKIEEDIKIKKSLNEKIAKMCWASPGGLMSHIKENSTMTIQKLNFEEKAREELETGVMRSNQRSIRNAHEIYAAIQNTEILHSELDALISQSIEDKKETRLSDLIRSFEEQNNVEQQVDEPNVINLEVAEHTGPYKDGLEQKRALITLLSSLEINMNLLLQNLDESKKELEKFLSRRHTRRIEVEEEDGDVKVEPAKIEEEQQEDSGSTIQEVPEEPLSQEELLEQVKLAKEAYVQLHHQKNMRAHFEWKTKEQEEFISQLKGVVYEQEKYKDCPSFYLTSKKNANLNKEMIKLHSNLRNLEIALETKDIEVQKNKDKTFELSSSVDNYARTCRDLFDQLESKSIEPNDLQINLDLKITEALELQKDISVASHRLSNQKVDIRRYLRVIDGMRLKVSDLQTQQRSNQKEITNLRSYWISRVSESKVLSAQINDLVNKLVDMEARTQEAEEEYKNEIAKVKLAIKALENSGDEPVEESGDLYASQYTATSMEGYGDDKLAKVFNFEESYLEKQRQHYREVLEIIKNYQAQEAEKEGEQDNQLLSLKEQEFNEQFVEIAQQLSRALRQLTHNDSEYKRLYGKIQTLEMELDLKNSQIQEYVESMATNKEQLNEYIQTAQKAPLIEKAHERVIASAGVECREEIMKQDINTIKFSDSFRKYRHDLSAISPERAKLISEIEEIKERELRLERLNEENEARIKQLTEERLNLLLSLENLKKGEIRVKMEEDTEIIEDDTEETQVVNQLKDEKARVAEELAKTNEINNQLRKELEELAMKCHHEQEQAKLELPPLEVPKLGDEPRVSTYENKDLSHLLFKLYQVLSKEFKNGEHNISGLFDDGINNIDELLQNEKAAPRSSHKSESKRNRKSSTKGKSILTPMGPVQMFNIDLPDLGPLDKENIDQPGQGPMRRRNNSKDHMPAVMSAQKIASGRSSVENTVTGKRNRNKFDGAGKSEEKGGLVKPINENRRNLRKASINTVGQNEKTPKKSGAIGGGNSNGNEGLEGQSARKKIKFDK